MLIWSSVSLKIFVQITIYAFSWSANSRIHSCTPFPLLSSLQLDHPDLLGPTQFVQPKSKKIKVNSNMAYHSWIVLEKYNNQCCKGFANNYKRGYQSFPPHCLAFHLWVQILSQGSQLPVQCAFAKHMFKTKNYSLVQLNMLTSGLGKSQLLN